jgi:hypothetical protein
MYRASLFVILFVSLTAPATALAERVRTRVTLAPGQVQLAPLRIDGFARNTTPGQPALPEREVAVALHPRAELATLRIELRSGPSDTLPGRHDLPPNPPYTVIEGGQTRLSWAGAGPVLAGRDLSVYGRGGDANTLFPAAVVTRKRVTNRRGHLVLHLRYMPVRYRHHTGELLVDRHTEAVVSYRVSSTRPAAPDPQLLPVLGRVVNPAQARSWHQAGLADTTTPVGYAIMIPEALQQKSARLADFIKHKQARGFVVTVVTDKDLADIKVGPEAGDAERMRTWLQQSYKTLNLKYLLIVGNPDPDRAGVPMKMTHPYVHINTSISAPSDHYYAELTGDWDLNGNGDVAEFPDDQGDGMDLTPELYVGRIPVYDNNVSTLDQILRKTMAYLDDQGDRSWRGRVLQPAAMLFYKGEYDARMDGASMAEAIYEQVIEPLGFTRFALYEEGGIDPSHFSGDAALTRQNVVAEWSKGYGLVTWFAHGSADGAFRTVWLNDNDGDELCSYKEQASVAFFSYDDTVQLDDSRPAFVYHGSCSNSTPEVANNVAYGLLRHGAIGTVGATRSAVTLINATGEIADDNLFGVERDFTRYLLEGQTAGEAMSAAKEKVGEAVGKIAWLTKIEFALYGDPSVPLITCAKDADCDDGKRCTGEEKCVLGQCVADKAVVCVSSDPCTEALCDESTGKCTSSPRPDDEACEDGKFCTVNERCQQGKCIGEPRCAAPNNPCVEGRCDEKARTCDVYPLLAEGQACHRGTDREGTCSAGICEPTDDGCAMAPGPPPGLPAAVLLLPLVLLLLGRRRVRARSDR